MRLALPALTAFVMSACVDGDTPFTPPVGSGDYMLAIRADMSLLEGSSWQGLPINRIRLTATNVSGSDTLSVQFFTVTDDAGGWTIPFEVPDSGTPIVITIELINLTDGRETVEFSAMTAPITLDAAGNASVTAPTPLPGPPGNLSVTSVSIVEPVASVVEGDSIQLRAVIVGGSASARPLWRTLDPTIASVTENGMLKPVRNGSVRIVAQAGPALDTVTVTATQRAASLRIVPDSINSGSLNETVTYVAVVNDPRGAPIVNAPAITWSIDNAAVASSVGGGSFRTNANGSTRVRAAVTGSTTLTSSAALVVAQRPARLMVAPAPFNFTAVGLTQAFTATAVDGTGNPVAITTPVSWSSSAATVVSITNAGVATAVSAGDAVITALTAGVTGTSNVTVRQTIASLDVTPATASIPSVGASTTLAVSARDANNNPIAAPTGITWTSADPTIATVSATGVVTAVKNGTVRINAMSGVATDFADITVRQVVTSITVTPPANDLGGTGATVQLTAVGRDANNNIAPAAVFTWTSASPDFATVNPTGLVTATGFGTATVTAAADGATGSAAIRVLRLTVTVTPEILTFNAVGAAGVAVATVTGPDGAPLPGAAVTWSSANTNIAVATGGDIYAISVGTTFVIASYGGSADSMTVVVTQVAASLTVTPTTVNAPAGTDVQLAVTARDANNNVIVNPALQYLSDAATVATVSPSGLVHTVAAGSTTVRISSGTVTINVPVTVTTAGTLPDLRVSAASVTPTGDLSVGAPANVSFTITSDFAPSAATAAVVTIYDDEGGVVITVPLSIPAIAGGGSHTVNLPFTPQNTWPDSVYARLVLDATNVVTESNESNNNVRFPAGVGNIAIIHPVVGDPTIEILPTFVMIVIAEIENLTATVRDGAGNVVPADVSWASLHTSVAVVDTAGRVTGLTNGFAQIIVTTTIASVVYSDTIVVQVGELDTPEGVTMTWFGPHDPDASRSWNVAAYWRENRLPNASDVVFIPDCNVYYDGVDGAARCSYPVLESNVTIAGLVTGFELDGGGEVLAATRMTAVADAVAGNAASAQALAVGLKRHEAAQKRVDAARARQPLSPASRSLGGTAVGGMVNSSSMPEEDPDTWHLDVADFELELTGDLGDFAFLGSSTDDGNVYLTGNNVAFNAVVLARVDISGSIESWYLVVEGEDLNIFEDASLTMVDSPFFDDGYGEVSDDVSIDDNGELNLYDDSYFRVGNDLDVDGGGVSLLNYNTYLVVDDTFTLENGAHLEIDEGEVYVGDYSDACVVVPGDFITRTGATFSMQEDYAYMTVTGDVDIGGGSTAGMLTSGELYILGDLTVGGSSNQAYAPSSGHDTQFGAGVEHAVTMALPGFGTSGNHFGSLSTYSSGNITFNNPLFVEGNFLSSNTGVTTGSVAHINGNIAVHYPAGWSIPQTTVGGSLYSIGPNALTTDLTVTGNAYSFYPFHLDGDLIITEDAYVTFNDGATITGGITIEDTGILLVTSSNPVTTSSLQTLDSGHVNMENCGGGCSPSLVVNGNAVFGGGPTELSVGEIQVSGNVSVTAPGALKGTSVSLTGSAIQQVSMVAPGLAPGQNSFGDLHLNNSAGVTFTSDIRVAATLRQTATFFTVNTTCASGCLITTNNAVLTSFTLNNTRLHVLNNASTYNFLTFTGPHTQLSLVRTVDVTLNGLNFTNTLAAGTAPVLVLDGLFNTTLNATNPAAISSSRVLLLNGATLTPPPVTPIVSMGRR